MCVFALLILPESKKALLYLFLMSTVLHFILEQKIRVYLFPWTSVQYDPRTE